MVIGRITYPDKKDYKVEGENDSYKVTAKDMNEIKGVFNDSAETIEETVVETEKLQKKIDTSVVDINNKVNQLGDYEVMSDDPTKIRFKKLNGEPGQTVDLGANVASKSFVYAGYNEVEGNSYSGLASNYGIDVTKIEGDFEQQKTNGYQLFDASKLSTKIQGGATVTNNGDGSFTVSGSGNFTSNFTLPYTYSHKQTVELLKVGTLKSAATNYVVPFFYFNLQQNGKKLYEFRINSATSSFNITEEMLNDETFYMIVGAYGGVGSAIIPGTIKPMVYFDGDGTFETFTNGAPSPSYNYP